MKITKLVHSCLLIETKGVKLITDIGFWETDLSNLSGLNAILITHEHVDHFDISKLKEVLSRNPDANVITHKAVGEKLTAEGIAYSPIEPGEKVVLGEVTVESFGSEHAPIHSSIPACRNTGYLIDERLYMPGDALHDVPSKPVEILALPTGGPWLKISEAIDYTLKLKPKVAFPIHDAMYKDAYRDSVPRWVTPSFEKEGISFINLSPSETREF